MKSPRGGFWKWGVGKPHILESIGSCVCEFSVPRCSLCICGAAFFSLLPGSLGPNLRQNYNNSMGLECLTLWLGFSRLIYIVPTLVVCSCYIICIVCSFCNPGVGRERNKLIIEGWYTRVMGTWASGPAGSTGKVILPRTERKRMVAQLRLEVKFLLT